MNQNEDTFGDRLKNLAKAQSLSQAKLGKSARVDRTTVGRIIKGERQPTGEQLDRLASALSMTREELVGPFSFDIAPLEQRFAELQTQLAEAKAQAEHEAARAAQAEQVQEALQGQVRDLVGAVQAARADAESVRSELALQRSQCAQVRGRADLAEAALKAERAAHHKTRKVLENVRKDLGGKVVAAGLLGLVLGGAGGAAVASSD